MQRYNNSQRFNIYNEGRIHRALPCFRQQVVPGQTVNLDASIHLETAPFTKNVLSPSLMSVWFFYVPHRLIWDGFTEFVSGQEDLASESVPSTGVEWTDGFDHIPTADPSNPNPIAQVNALYRRAYKYVYNEYFGDRMLDVVYDDITADDDLPSPGGATLKTSDQFMSKFVSADDTTDAEFTVTDNKIPLNQFHREMMFARSRRRSKMSGDKYVDALARMGVDGSWLITDRPEFLGTRSQLVNPTKIDGTGDTSLGQLVAKMSTTLRFSLRSKQFAEHGYVIGICGIRPTLSIANACAMDSHFRTRDLLYTADNLQTADGYLESRVMPLGVNATIMRTSRLGYLRHGQNMSGSGDGWSIQYSPTTLQEMIYPFDAEFPVETTAGLGTGKEFAVQVAAHMTGKTPVSKSVA